MIIDERSSRHQAVIDAAKQLLTAIRTAPKARGVDIIEAIIVEGDDLRRLSDAMLELHEATGRPVYKRDATNILQGEAVIIIGTHHQPLGLNCGHCGFPTCGDKPKQAPCAVNAVDVGIAIGSACSKAADLRLDTRVMFSAGKGAMHLGLLPDCRQLYAIAISASSKNPFFDRG
jgi:uncharacterized ferredoxin-like protein